jgi:hypothetical protein
MTTIRFNKDKGIKRIMTACCLGVGGMTCAVFISYACLVGARHDLISLRSSLETTQIKNAELKNAYFQLTNVENLEKLAGEMGLVQDRDPRWVFASQS